MKFNYEKIKLQCWGWLQNDVQQYFLSLAIWDFFLKLLHSHLKTTLKSRGAEVTMKYLKKCIRVKPLLKYKVFNKVTLEILTFYS